MSAIKTLINGTESESLGISDRGFQYGDGVFETIFVKDGIPLFLDRHLHRLADGCRRLAIKTPDFLNLAQESKQLCQDQDCGILKIIVTRGQGGRGYRYFPDALASRILSLYPKPDYPVKLQEKGVNIRVCSARLGINPLLAGIKHLNRLEQVIARAEWRDPEILEGIMCDSNDRVVEGTMSNLFFVKDHLLCTPDVESCGVAGVMRARIIDIAQQNGLPIKIVQIKVEDLIDAEEIFLTNSVICVWPVVRMDNYSYKIGPITRNVIRLVDAQKNDEIKLKCSV